MFIAQNMVDNADREEIDAIFAELDTDGNGKLDKDEIRSGFEDLLGWKMTDKEVDQFFKQYDATGDGQLTYNEWVVAATAYSTLFSDKKLQAAFNEFDKDGSGKITKEELK